MTQDHHSRDHEEQSVDQSELDYEFDGNELCRKPKEASRPRDVHIIMDVSAESATRNGSLPLMKMAVRALLKALSPGERIELTKSNQHGDRLLRRIPVEDVDEVDFEKKLDSLTTEGTSHVFDNVLQRLAELDDLGDREVTVVVMTGSMDEDWASSGIMEDLNRQIQRRVKPRFVFLGIHLPADAALQLHHLCRPYRHASFTELTRPAAQIDGLFSSKLLAKHSLEIDIRRPCPAGVIGRPVDLLVIIRNNSDETIPAGSRLYLNPNGYFRPTFAELPEIPVDRVHGQVLRACPRGRVTVSDLQERCEVSIQDRDRRAIATQPFFLDMVDFIGELGNKRHPIRGRSLNLYVIGAQGSGKGSFINTLLTMLSDGDGVITAGADVGGGADHQTDRLTAFNVGKTMRSTRLPKFPFRIFDTWGMDTTNYQRMELATMLRGLLPVGWHMEDDAGRLVEEAGMLNATCHQREAHAVYFFVSFAQVDDDDHKKCLQAHFRTVKEMGLNPMVVLARVDEDEPAIRDDPLNWQLPKIAEYRQKVADMLQVGLAHVLVSVPYVTQDSLERSFAIEKLAYHNLRCGLDSAIHYLMTKAADRRRGGQHVGCYEDDDDDEEEEEEGYAARYAAEEAAAARRQEDVHAAGREEHVGMAGREREGGDDPNFGVRSFVSDTSSVVSSSVTSSARRHGGGWHDDHHHRMPPPPPPAQYYYRHHHGQHQRLPASPFDRHGGYRGGKHHGHHAYQHHRAFPHASNYQPAMAGGMGLDSTAAPCSDGRAAAEEEDGVLVPPMPGGAAASQQAVRAAAEGPNPFEAFRAFDALAGAEGLEQFRAQYYGPRKPQGSPSP